MPVPAYVRFGGTSRTYQPDGSYMDDVHMTLDPALPVGDTWAERALLTWSSTARLWMLCLFKDATGTKVIDYSRADDFPELVDAAEMSVSRWFAELPLSLPARLDAFAAEFEAGAEAMADRFVSRRIEGF